MGIITSMIIGGIIGYLVGSIIDEMTIREQLQDDGAFYGTITRIQPKTVTIKEIDEEGDFMQYRKLESEKGLSDELHIGDVIYAYE